VGGEKANAFERAKISRGGKSHTALRNAAHRSSGIGALNREISVCAGLRGGAGRTRTSNQTVIAET
jgi:hypothetical protein